MKNGNNLGFTVFASFGAYYFSFATTMTPAFGLEAAYSNTDEYNNAIAILFLCWSFLFLLFVIVGIRTNLVLVGIFVSVTLTAVFVSASHFVAPKHQDTIAATFENENVREWYAIGRSCFSCFWLRQATMMISSPGS